MEMNAKKEVSTQNLLEGQVQEDDAEISVYSVECTRIFC
jgi:hypothetical protein